MDKPVDGAEALAREVLLSVLKPGTAAWIAVQSGASLKYHSMRVEKVITAMLAHSAALVAENQRLTAENERLKRPSIFWIDEDPEAGYCDPWEALEAALYHSVDEGIAAIRTGREIGVRFYGRLGSDDEIGIDHDWMESFATKAEADAAIDEERSRRAAARTALETRNG